MISYIRTFYFRCALCTQLNLHTTNSKENMYSFSKYQTTFEVHIPINLFTAVILIIYSRFPSTPYPVFFLNFYYFFFVCMSHPFSCHLYIVAISFFFPILNCIPQGKASISTLNVYCMYKLEIMLLPSLKWIKCNITSNPKFKIKPEIQQTIHAFFQLLPLSKFLAVCRDLIFAANVYQEK